MEHATGGAERRGRSVRGMAGHVVPVLVLTVVSAGCGAPDDKRSTGPGTTPYVAVSTADATTEPPSESATERPDARARLPRFLRPWLVVPDGADLPAARPGTVVRKSRPDPVGGDGHSLGLLLERGARSLWALAVVDADGLHVDSTQPRLSSWLTFDQWLTDTADVERGGPGLVLADLAHDGSVVPVARGARVLDQVAVPDDLMSPFRMARARPAAVAIVRWQGHRWYVFVERRLPRNWRITVGASRIGLRARTATELLVRWDRFGHRP